MEERGSREKERNVGWENRRILLQVSAGLIGIFIAFVYIHCSGGPYAASPDILFTTVLVERSSVQNRRLPDSLARMPTLLASTLAELGQWVTVP